MKVYQPNIPYDFEVYEDRTDEEFMQDLIDLADVIFERDKTKINEFIDSLNT